MEELKSWLERIGDAKPEELSEQIFRVVLPGSREVGFSDTIVKLEHRKSLAPRPGSTEPGTVNVLRFLDTGPWSMTAAEIAAELGTVLALASDRRIEVAMELPLTVEGRPSERKTLLPLGSVIDRRARGPFEETLRDEFIEIAGQIQSLGKKDLEALGAATRLHYGALLLGEKDIGTAYVLLVAGLEVLSREYGNPPDSWRDWEGSSAWDDLLEEHGLAAEQCEAIRAELMKDRYLRLKATFRNYVVNSLPASFWSGEWNEWHSPIEMKDGNASWGKTKKVTRPMKSLIEEKDALFDALGRSYDLRSGVVHRGDRVRIMEVGMTEGPVVKPKEPVPYALLRQILRTLIRHEMDGRATAEDLPDIRFK